MNHFVGIGRLTRDPEVHAERQSVREIHACD